MQNFCVFQGFTFRCSKSSMSKATAPEGAAEQPIDKTESNVQPTAVSVCNCEGERAVGCSSHAQLTCTLQRNR